MTGTNFSKKLEILAKSKIKRPPTDICGFQNKIYVSTKGKRVFYTSDLVGLKEPFKTVLFTSQVNSISSNFETLFACQKNGVVFGLTSTHKTAFKVSTGDSPCIFSFFDSKNDNFYVGSETKKISVFSSKAILKNTHFFNEGKLSYFDVSNDQMIARCFQNDQNVQFVDSKGKFNIKIMDGSPEIVKFLTDDLVLIGSSTGIINCFSVVSKKRISFLKLDDQITSIHSISSNIFFVGTPKRILLIDFSNFNKMEIADQIEVKGIPVAFYSEESNNEGTVVYCAISRESRIGRWTRIKDGHNQLMKLKLNK